MGTTEEIVNDLENPDMIPDTDIVEADQETLYVLRNPKATDIASFLKLFSKLRIKELKESISGDTLKRIIQIEREKNKDDDDAFESIGISLAFEMIDIIIDRLSECQWEVFKCLSCLSGMSVEDIAELDLSVFTQMLYDAIMLPGFADFIKVVSRLYEKKH